MLIVHPLTIHLADDMFSNSCGQAFFQSLDGQISLSGTYRCTHALLFVASQKKSCSKTWKNHLDLRPKHEILRDKLT